MFLSNRSRLILVVFSIIGTNFFPTVSSAQSKVEQLLNKLDKSYYYPQNKGLVRISSQLKWEQENIESKKTFAVKKPNFIFKGEFDGKTFKKRIKSSDSRKNIPDEETIQNIKFLNNYLDAFFPKTLREKFIHYKGIIGARGASEIRLLLRKTGPMDEILMSMNYLSIRKSGVFQRLLFGRIKNLKKWKVNSFMLKKVGNGW